MSPEWFRTAKCLCGSVAPLKLMRPPTAPKGSVALLMTAYAWEMLCLAGVKHSLAADVACAC